jgi:tellurite resistance protein TehA-like permease
MATGIVSLALSLDGQPTLARALLMIAALQWLGLAVAAASLFARHPASAVRRVRSPATLTAVADTAVLGTGLATVGWTGAATVMLTVAVVLWLTLVEEVLAHLQARTTGTALMVAVAPASLAVLAATIATDTRASWLAAASLVPFLLGLGLYCMVLCRFDVGQLLRGDGDQWVTGGALAISALAGAKASAAGHQLHTLAAITGPLQTASVVLWGLALLWLAPLVTGELVRPRLHYRLARWATVFPLGMYAASSFQVGMLTHASGPTTFAEITVWVALCAWAATSAGILHRGLLAHRHQTGAGATNVR